MRNRRIASSAMVLALVSFCATSSQTQAPAASFNGLISMCEDSDGCAQWAFQGGHGVARWANGAIATLTVENLDARSVTIRRSDADGLVKGLTAVYTGKRTGDLIEGTLLASWPGHLPEGAKTNWHAFVSPRDMPKADPASADTRALFAGWSECEDLGNACATENPPARYVWAFTAQKQAMQNMDEATADIRIVLHSAAPGAIVIRRFDSTGKFAGLTGLYTGVREGSTIKGTVIWIWPGHANQPLKGSWTASILPRACASAEPDKTLQGNEAAIATVDFILGDSPGGFKCTLASAQHGDGQAQMNVGLMYIRGEGTAKDPRQAVLWTQKSAAQGNIFAAKNLATMYRLGQGVPVDTLRAELLDESATLSQWAFEDAQRPPAGNVLDLIGNYIADTTNIIFLAKRGFAGSELARRVEHRSAVVGYMDQGMSRVQAEVKVAVEEDAAGQAEYARCYQSNGGNAGATTNDSSTSFPTHRTASENRSDAADKCSLIDAASAASRISSGQYLNCVHKFIDSEAIEKNCHL